MQEPRTNLDRQVGEWLRDESTTKAPDRVIENVFAATTRSRQVRRWWPPALWTQPMERRLSMPVALAVVAIVVVSALAVARLPTSTRVGVQPTPAPSAAASPSAVAPLPSPNATTLDGLSAQVVRLGADAGPIDVVEAFGSIWVANMHSNDVIRIDGTTLEQQARIPAGTGPAWFAATETGLWVTNQLGVGLRLIDPATNTVVTTVGDGQPCGAPVIAFGDLWASACDDHEMLRIDLAAIKDMETGVRLPSTDQVYTKIPALGYAWLALVDGRLISGSRTTLAEIDPATNEITDLGICCGDVMGSDGQTVWLNRGSDIARVDLDGTVLAKFPYPGGETGVTFVDGRAWLSVSGTGAVEVDLSTNEVLRTIHVPAATLLAREIDGVLWVTNFDTSDLWRIDL
jgi:YVTN family beta-propeller protein